MKITFTFIKSRGNRFQTLISKILFIVFALLSFYLSAFTDYKILMTISLVLMMGIGVFLNFSEKIIKIGLITLGVNNLELRFTNSVTKTYNLSELKDLKFKYFGYKGEAYILNPKSLIPKRGNENYLAFRCEQKNHKYEMIIKRNQVYTLKTILCIWQKKYDFKYINECGKEVKEL